ncbi:MAG: ABC transporter ATP-binding protein [Phycisphaerae bacterium]
MIRTVQLRKLYHMGACVVHALDGVDLTIEAGEFVSIVGPSGSGKSTLMHILGCLDRPTSGVFEFRGNMVSAMRDSQLASLRNQHIGFVFQTFNLINRTSALENVCLPLVYTRKAYSKAPAREALDRVGLKDRARHKPSELSGGECQRVAIARAIVNNPDLLLADEPTGNLDSRTSAQIMETFLNLHDKGLTIVLVTHEMDIAVQADRIISMKDGRVIDDTVVDNAYRNEVISIAKTTQRRLLRQKPAV